MNRGPTWTAVWLAGMALFSAAPLWARTTASAELPGWLVDRYTDDDGLPSLALTGVAEAADGSLWLASFAGLLRLDGVTATLVTRTSTPALPGNRYTALHADAQQCLWATEEHGGLVRTCGQTFASWLPNVELQGQARLMRAIDGRLWLATTRGVASLTPSGPIPWRADELRKEVAALTSDSHAGVWAATTDSEVWHLPVHGPVRRIPWPAAAERVGLHAALTDANGRVWLGGTWSALFRIEADQLISVVGPTSELGDRPLRELAMENDGSLVGRTDDRWLKLKDGRWTAHPQLDGAGQRGEFHWISRQWDGVWWQAGAGGLYRDRQLILRTHGRLRSLARDRRGWVWATIDGEGLVCLRPRRIKPVYVAEGSDPIVEVVATDGHGRLWAANHSLQLLAAQSGADLRPHLVPAPRQPEVRTVMSLPGGDLLVGADDGVALYTGATWTAFDLPWPRHEQRKAVSLALATSGDLWVATEGGLSVLPDGLSRLRSSPGRRGFLEWRQARLTDGSEISNGRDFAALDDGEMLLATADQGLVHIRDELGVTFPAAVGLPTRHLRGLVRDHDGWWIGTEDAGLCHLRWQQGQAVATGQARCLGVDRGLVEDAVHAVYVGPDQSLWLAGNRGLSVIHRRDLMNALGSARGLVMPLLLDHRHGMPVRELNGRLRPALAKSSRGVLWLPSQRGVVEVDTRDFRWPDPPSVRIVEALEGGLRHDISKPINALQHGSSVKLKWSSAEFEWPDRVRFRYRTGQDVAWSPSTSERSALWQGLGPGEHKLEVQAGFGGSWSASAALTVYRPPTVFEQTLFVPLVAAAGALLAAGAAGWGIRRSKRRQADLESLVAARTGELAERNTILHSQRETLIAQGQALAGHAQELDAQRLLKDRMVANISHELRTPLMLVQAPLERLIGAAGPDQRHLLDIAAANVQRLRELIDQLLLAAQGDAGTTPLQVQRLDLGPFMRAILGQFQVAAQAKGVKLTGTTPPAKALVLADLDLMNKVVSNLLVNALKFTSAGGHISVEVFCAAGRCGISVADSGIGIPSESKERIFERFYQVHAGDDRSAEGTGIGLSLAAELMHLMGGGIDVESQSGVGSTFRAWLPRAADEDGTVASPRPSDSTSTELTADSISMPSRRPLILVVEDNAALMDHLVCELGKTYQICTAADGQSALEAMARQRPQVVVSDIMMPGMDGLTLCRTMRTNPDLRDIPVLFTSAKGSRADLAAGLAVAQDYLVKPFSSERLIDRVERLLAGPRLGLPGPETPANEATRLGTNGEEQGHLPATDERFLLRLEAVIASRLDDDQLAIPEIAKAMAMGERQLQRNVKRLLGIAPLDHLQNIRIRFAEQWLCAGQFSTVAEVAAAVGMSPRTLRRAYAERKGRSPSSALASRTSSDSIQLDGDKP